jgi:penicillin-binding protein 1A
MTDEEIRRRGEELAVVRASRSRRSRQRKLEEKRRSRRRTQARGWAALVAILVPVVLLVAAVAAGAAVALNIWDSADGSIDPRKIERIGRNTEILDRNGNLLGFLNSERNSEPVLWSQIPQSVIDSTIAIEDQRFWEHKGVNWERVASAAYQNYKAGHTTQGGSTITQQLIKNSYLRNDERTLDRKLEEAKKALELEKVWSKQKILTQYLNSTFYGNFAYGIQAAARIYFGKQAKDLTVPEAALLAGIPNAPTEFNPLGTYEQQVAAKQRRDTVLQEMVDSGALTQEQADRYKAQGMRLDPHPRYYDRVRSNPLFYNYVRQQLEEEYGDEVANKGLTVKTTINPDFQRMAHDTMAQTLAEAAPYGPVPDAAIVTLDTTNGEIVAMESVMNSTDDDQFNLALGRRQPGSTAKIWGLTAAIEDGINPQTTYYVSRPIKEDIPGYGPVDVHTYGDSYRGRISLAQATLASDNSVYFQLGVDLGPKRVVEEAYNMGITRDTLPEVLSVILGAGEVTPLDQASAFGTLANGGVYNKPNAVLEISDGGGDKARNPFKPKPRRAFADGVAYEVTQLLCQNVVGGTGTRAALPNNRACGKTGTTDDNGDAWFVGFTKQYVTAVWVGFAESNLIRMRSQFYGAPVDGGTFPALIWGRYMSQVMEGLPALDWEYPKEPVQWVRFTSEYSSMAGSSSSGSTDESTAATSTAEVTAEAATVEAPTEPVSPPGPPITEPPVTDDEPASPPTTQPATTGGFQPAPSTPVTPPPPSQPPPQSTSSGGGGSSTSGGGGGFEPPPPAP